MTSPGSPRGGHHGPGRGEVMGLHSHPPALPPLSSCPISPPPPLRPEGTPGSGEGGPGAVGCPRTGVLPQGWGESSSPRAPEPGCGGAGGAARRDTGCPVWAAAAEPPGGRRGCPVKNTPPARTQRHEAGSRVDSPVPLSQSRLLSPLLPVLPARRRAAAGTGRGSAASRSPMPPLQPQGLENEAGTPPGEEGTPQASQPRDAPAARDRPAPGTSGGDGEAAGPSPRCGLPVPPCPRCGVPLLSVQCPCPPVGCP